MSAPASHNLKLVIEYEGTDFAGWQRQDGQDVRTVQGEIERAFKSMTGDDVFVRGAGRTDAGVHAWGQVANAGVKKTISDHGWRSGLNAHLAPDVAVLDCTEVDAAFNARFSARGKLYRYRIWNHMIRSPIDRRFAWHHRFPLDTHAMRDAAALLVGEHDFRGFRAADCERRTTRRVLTRVDVQREGAAITIEVEGTAFLKNMVRIIAGTLCAVGRGDMDTAAVEAVLHTGDRARAGVTAPAAGLALVRVNY